LAVENRKAHSLAHRNLAGSLFRYCIVSLMWSSRGVTSVTSVSATHNSGDERASRLYPTLRGRPPVRPTRTHAAASLTSRSGRRISQDSSRFNNNQLHIHRLRNAQSLATIEFVGACRVGNRSVRRIAMHGKTHSSTSDKTVTDKDASSLVRKFSKLKETWTLDLLSKQVAAMAVAGRPRMEPSSTQLWHRILGLRTKSEISLVFFHSNLRVQARDSFFPFHDMRYSV
jgi:hypothetical protein